jgi:hypothetical protein
MSPDTDSRPTLLNSCAAASTAKEARFRINARERRSRATRVVALDPGARELADRLGHETWREARLLVFSASAAVTAAEDSELADVDLETGDGTRTTLVEQLADADFLMMLATAGSGAAAAGAIGNACSLRGIMTAGLVLGQGAEATEAVSALRPYARVLLVTEDQQDVDAILTAVGS